MTSVTVQHRSIIAFLLTVSNRIIRVYWSKHTHILNSHLKQLKLGYDTKTILFPYTSSKETQAHRERGGGIHTERDI